MLKKIPYHKRSISSYHVNHGQIVHFTRQVLHSVEVTRLRIKSLSSGKRRHMYYFGKYLSASRWNHIALYFGRNNNVFYPEKDGRKLRLQLRCASTNVHGVRSRNSIVLMCTSTRLLNTQLISINNSNNKVKW
jgi:hypothetical protein